MRNREAITSPGAKRQGESGLGVLGSRADEEGGESRDGPGRVGSLWTDIWFVQGTPRCVSARSWNTE